jgi:hypothetical protein
MYSTGNMTRFPCTGNALSVHEQCRHSAAGEIKVRESGLPGGGYDPSWIKLVRKSAVRAIVSMAGRMSFGRIGSADNVPRGLDFDGAAAAGPELGQFN